MIEATSITPERDRGAPNALAGPLGALFLGGRRQRLRAGAILFSEGDVSNRVALVLEGRLKVSSFTEDGRETVLGFRERGDVLGEFAAVDGEPHLANVTAVETSEVLVIPSDRFLAALEDHPALTLTLLRSVIARLRDADRKRIEFGAFDAVGRVSRRLVELADHYGETSGDGVRIALAITQSELAGWVGCSREAVNKALHRLRDRGLISIGRGHITVLDLEGLRRRAPG